jgi:hypothetical protein
MAEPHPVREVEAAARSRLRHWPVVRDLTAGARLEWLLVFAIATIVVTRAILELAGYPQIGGGTGLHVAHVLWGGLLMLVALLLLLGTVGGGLARGLGVLAGGIGFGLFIDEVGKFLTADTNYFFRPSFAIMYVVFVTLFLVIRTSGRRVPQAPSAYLANTLALATRAATGGLPPADRDRALIYLSRARDGDPLEDALRTWLLADARVTREFWMARQVDRVQAGVSRAYVRVVEWRWFPHTVGLLYLFDAVADLLTIASALADPGYSVADTLQGFGAGVCGVLGLIGVVQLARRRRLSAYRWFERSTLVSLLVLSLFAFLADLWVGLGHLALNMALLALVRFAINQEEAAERRAEVRAPVVRVAPQPAL